MTSTPEGASETGVPEMITPDPPAVSVVPSMENADGLAVKVWPAMVKISPALGEELAPAGGRVMLDDPMTRTPDGASDTGVPEIATPEPPAVSVVPSMENADGFGVKVWPPTVNTVGDGIFRATVALPITAMPDDPSENAVPPIVAAGPPGVRVVLPTMRAVGLAVMVCPPRVNTSADGPPGEAPTDAMTRSPEGATENIWVERVRAGPLAVKMVPAMAMAEDPMAVYGGGVGSKLSPLLLLI